MEKNDISTTQKESLPGMFLFGPCVEHLGLAPKNRKAIFPNKKLKVSAVLFFGCGRTCGLGSPKGSPKVFKQRHQDVALLYATGMTEPLNCFKYLGWLQIIRTSNRKCSIWIFQGMILSHSIHVWYIYLHLVDVYSK